MAKLTSSADKEEVWRAAVELQLTRRLLNSLLTLPATMVEELKEEGDSIYGV